MRIHGNEGEFLSDQEQADAIQNHSNSFSAEPTYLKSIIFGKRFIKSILSVEGAKGLICIMGLLPNVDTGSNQEYPIPRAVDKHGNILPYPETLEFDEDNDEEGGVIARGDSDPKPIKCPTSCG